MNALVPTQQPREQVATLAVDLTGAGEGLSPHDFKTELDRLIEEYGTVFVSIEELSACIVQVAVWR